MLERFFLHRLYVPCKLLLGDWLSCSRSVATYMDFLETAPSNEQLHLGCRADAGKHQQVAQQRDHPEVNNQLSSSAYTGPDTAPPRLSMSSVGSEDTALHRVGRCTPAGLHLHRNTHASSSAGSDSVSMRCPPGDQQPRCPCVAISSFLCLDTMLLYSTGSAFAGPYLSEKTVALLHLTLLASASLYVNLSAQASAQ